MHVVFVCMFQEGSTSLCCLCQRVDHRVHRSQKLLVPFRYLECLKIVNGGQWIKLDYTSRKFLIDQQGCILWPDCVHSLDLHMFICSSLPKNKIPAPVDREVAEILSRLC